MMTVDMLSASLLAIKGAVVLNSTALDDMAGSRAAHASVFYL